MAAPTPTTRRGSCFRLEVLPVVDRCQRLTHPRARKSGQQLPAGGFCSQFPPQEILGLGLLGLRPLSQVQKWVGLTASLPAVAKFHQCPGAGPAALPLPWETSHHTIPGEVGRQRGKGGREEKGLLTTARTELAKVVSMPTEHQFLQAALRGTSRSLSYYLGDSWPLLG